MLSGVLLDSPTPLEECRHDDCFGGKERGCVERDSERCRGEHPAFGFCSGERRNPEDAVQDGSGCTGAFE